MNLRSGIVSAFDQKYEPPLSSDFSHLGLEQKGELIQKGASGHVYKVKGHGNTTFAVKVINSYNSIERKFFDNEVKRLFKLNNLDFQRGIVEFYGSYEINHKLFIINQFYNEIDLFHFIEKKEKRELFEQIFLTQILLEDILHGLNVIHSSNWVHRDIKPHNILVHNENGQMYASIADFGTACDAGKPYPPGKFYEAGTDGYFSPELNYYLKYHSFTYIVSPAEDIYALGLSLHFLLCNKQETKEIRDLSEALIQTQQVQDFNSVMGNFLKNSTINAPMTCIQKNSYLHLIEIKVKEIILNCIQIDINLRPTAKKLLTKTSEMALKQFFLFRSIPGNSISESSSQNVFNR